MVTPFGWAIISPVPMSMPGPKSAPRDTGADGAQQVRQPQLAGPEEALLGAG